MRGLWLGVMSAAVVLVSCRSVDKDKLQLFLDSAVVYYDEGDLVKAEGQARKAVELDPNDLKALTILAMTRARQGNAGDMNALSESIVLFERAADHGGRDEFQILLGRGMAQSARARLALARVEVLSKPQTSTLAPAPDASSAISKEIERLRETAKADLDEAEKSLLRAHEELPDFLAVLDSLQALYSLRDEPEKSIEWGRKVVEQTNKGREEKEKILARAGRSVEAEGATRREMRRFLDAEVNSRSLMALMLHRQGKDREAVDELDRVLTIDPNRVEDYFNRGVCRQIAADYAGARRDFEVFLRRSSLPADSPTIRDAWDRIAECERHIAPGSTAPLSSKP